MRKILGYSILGLAWLTPLVLIYFQGGWSSLLFSFIGSIICTIALGGVFLLGCWLIFGEE